MFFEVSDLIDSQTSGVAYPPKCLFCISHAKRTRISMQIVVKSECLPVNWGKMLITFVCVLRNVHDIDFRMRVTISGAEGGKLNGMK